MLDFQGFLTALKKDKIQGVLLTGNYPSEWVTEDLSEAIDAHAGRFVVLIDTLPNALLDRADVVLPGATWVEKAGTFENANNRLQSFQRAIEPIDYCKSECQIALDLLAAAAGGTPRRYDDAAVRQAMAEQHGLDELLSDVHHPPGGHKVVPDMQLVQL